MKIILTVSESDSSFVLKALQNTINSENFLQLSSFTQEQWEDVLTYGGGATNRALQLPDSWKKSEERAPIQAKVSTVLLLDVLKIMFASFSDLMVVGVAWPAQVGELIDLIHQRKSV